MKKVLFLIASVAIIGCSSDIDEVNTVDLEPQITTKYFLATHPNDGLIVRIGPNDCYWVFGGELRHIESLLTYNGLFVKNKKIKYYSSLDQIRLGLGVFSIGEPLTADNGLIASRADGKVYFRDGNVLSHIQSREAFDKYQFSDKPIIKVDYVKGVYEGPVVHPTYYLTPDARFEGDARYIAGGIITAY